MALDLDALKESLRQRGIDVLRVMYSDVLGIPRSKDLLVSHLDRSAHGGPAFCQGIWNTNTQGGVLDAANILSDGLQDLLGRIEPETITPMPWEPGVAYVIMDALEPNGKPNLFSPRTALQLIIAKYHELGLRPIVGPELEFYIADRTPEDSGVG